MSDWGALSFFAHKVRARAEDRARRGLPPEPAPTSEQVRQRLVDNLTRPNALLANLRQPPTENP